MTSIVTVPDTHIFQLPKGLDQRLQELAQKTAHSVEFCVVEALKTYVEDQEDYLIASQRLKEFEESGEKAIPFEEVVKELGLDDDA
jgi:RHH-type rel operon transcriptional repressor/antitoxin RelB